MFLIKRRAIAQVPTDASAHCLITISGWNVIYSLVDNSGIIIQLVKLFHQARSTCREVCNKAILFIIFQTFSNDKGL